MKLVLLSAVSLLLSMSQSAYARGGSVGADGGQAVRCTDGSVEFLDFFEASRMFGVQIPNVNNMDFENEWTRRLELIVPPGHEIFNSFKLTELPNQLMVPVFGLELLPDFRSSFLRLPPTCWVFQAATFTRARTLQQSVIRVDERFFKTAPAVQLDIALLHEDLHSYFPSIRDNRAVRQLVISLLAGDAFIKANRAALRELLATKRFVPWEKFKPRPY